MTKEWVVLRVKMEMFPLLPSIDPKKSAIKLNDPLTKAPKPADVMQSLPDENNLHFIYKANG